MGNGGGAVKRILYKPFFKTKQKMPNDIRALNFGKDDPHKREEVFIASFLLENKEIRQSIPPGNINLYCKEEPDFHLSFDSNSNLRIGLELTKCYAVADFNYTQIEDNLQKLCEEAISEYKETSGNNVLLSSNSIHVVFYHEIMVGGFDKSARKKIKNELKQLLSGNYDQPRHFIDRIFIKKRVLDFEKQIEVSSNMAYLVPQLKHLEPDPVILSIKKKETALERYKKRDDNSDVSHWWLCVSVPDEAYLNPTGYNLPQGFESGYNRIFLVKTGAIGYGVRTIYTN